jgi:uncharacterized protein (TIGR01619 family)
MLHGWNSYFCNVNDKVSSIFLNLDLRKSAPDATKPWLLWVWVYFRHPRPDGLSSREEFDTLSALEDTLTTAIEQHCQATMCGQITTDGRREVYFYASQPQYFEEEVKRSLAQFELYEFDCNKQQDPAWNQYLNVLYPSEEDIERIKNREVLSVLERHGDTLGSPRDILHWAYFKTVDDRSDFRNSAQALGYRTDSESQLKEKDCPYGICIGKQQDMESDALDRAVIELFRAAKRANGEYDGWESPVIVGKPAEQE